MIVNSFNFQALALFSLLAFNLHASELSPMARELELDKIETNPYKYKEMNPLKRLVRPKYNSNALDYEYHAWSEKDETGVYPIYRWELVTSKDGINSYELARYWDDRNTLGKENFYKEMSDQEREVLYYNLKNGVLMGGLTKTKFAGEVDSKKFFLISLRPVNVKEKLIPSFVPPAPTKSPEKLKQPPALTIDPKEIELEPKVKESTTQGKKQLRFGIPMQGNKDFILSPSSSEGSGGKPLAIDIRIFDKNDKPTGERYAPGTEVGDPHTGEVILVP